MKLLQMSAVRASGKMKALLVTLPPSPWLDHSYETSNSGDHVATKSKVSQKNYKDERTQVLTPVTNESAPRTGHRP